MRHTCTKMQALEIFISWLADKSEAPALKLLCQQEVKWRKMKRGVLQVLGKKLSSCQQSKSGVAVGSVAGCTLPMAFPPRLMLSKKAGPKWKLRSKFMRGRGGESVDRVHGDDVFKYFMSPKMRINIWVPKRVGVSQSASLAGLSNYWQPKKG